MSDKRGHGRNGPCPCGSGKKFKKCCLGTEAWQVQGRDDKGTITQRAISPPPQPDEDQLDKIVDEMQPALDASPCPAIMPPFAGEEWASERVATEDGRRRFIDYFKAYRVGLFGDEVRLPAYVSFVEDVATQHAEKDVEGKRAATDKGIIELLGIAIAFRENPAGLTPHQCFEFGSVVHDFCNHYLRAVLFPREDEEAKAAVLIVQMGLSLIDNYLVMWLIDTIDTHFGMEPGGSMMANTARPPAAEEEAPTDATA